jgi:hypothetical protein
MLSQQTSKQSADKAPSELCKTRYLLPTTQTNAPAGPQNRTPGIRVAKTDNILVS